MNVKEIRLQAKAWMVMNRIRAVDIQRALDLKDHAEIVKTLQGRKNHRKTLQYLLDQGCPAEYLAIPAGRRKVMK